MTRDERSRLSAEDGRGEFFGISMPVLAIGSGRSEARGRGGEPQESLPVIADNVTGVVIATADISYRKKAEELAAHLLDHFDRYWGRRGAVRRTRVKGICRLQAVRCRCSPSDSIIAFCISNFCTLPVAVSGN